MDFYFKIPVTGIRRPLEVGVNAILVRLLLLFLGFWSLSEMYVPSKRKNKKPKARPGKSVLSGHVVVCNHSSYIDILYLQYRFAPVFLSTQTSWDDESDVKDRVIVRSFWGALRDSIIHPTFSRSDTTSFQQVLMTAASQQKPLVFFPEGGTTNGTSSELQPKLIFAGKVLLGPVPILSSDSTDTFNSGTVHVLALRFLQQKISPLILRYENGMFPPVFTCGSVWKHFLQLLLEWKHGLQLRYVIDDDLKLSSTGNFDR